MEKILKGAPAAEAINERTRAKVAELKARGITPTLATLRVGEREDDVAYERGASKRCASVGVEWRSVVLPADVTQDALMEQVEALNKDAAVHGVLIFLPLPKHLDGEAVRKALSPEKDIDGITDGSMVGVFAGRDEGFPPCTAQACIEILDYYGVELKGKRAVVVGRSLVIGKPVGIMLLGRHATVTTCHTRTVDMPSVTREADVLIAAAGKAGVIGAEYVSDKQVVIDVGINVNDEGKLCGDVDYAAVEPIVTAISPVPGGVGSVTTSVLVSHVVEAAIRMSK